MADRDLCGRTLGEFVLRERIGEGGCGDVYRSSQPSLERDVVIKVLREPRRRNDDARERFLREAQLASRLDHPYAAHVYAFGVEPNDGLRWIAMELVQGITLDDWLRKHGPMPLDRFVRFFRCVAEVIQAAHERGIIHRDLKPANVMVMERGGRLLPKLVDFGLAKANQELARAAADEVPAVTTGGNHLDDSASAREMGTVPDPGASDWRLTPAGVGIGSWAYMSPEQWGNARDVGPASDIYSLGILAYRTLTGRVPFTANNEQEYREHHRSKPVPPLGGEFSPAIDRVLQRAMAKAPEARHPTALRFAAELRAAQRSSERELLRSSAEQWAARAQAPGLLWGGDVLADVDRWTRQAPRGSLTELECSFVAASRKRVRRSVWYRRSLIAAAALLVIGAVEYRSVVRARAAEDMVTQAEVEQGRQALLHDEIGEAQLHLAEAYRRGDHSPGTAFMLGRALQPRRAELASLPSTSGRMWYAAFSPNGRQVLTTDDRSAQVWDAATGRRLHVLPHAATVFSAAYSADGTWFVTACGDGAVRIWNSADGTLVRELRHPNKQLRYYIVAISGDRRWVAAIDITGERTDLWNAETGALVAELINAGAMEYPAIAFSDDTHWLATSGGGDVQVINISNGRTAFTAGSRIRSLSFDPAGLRLVTGAAGGDITIWSIPDGARAHHLREIGESVDRIAWSPDGRLVAAASRDGSQQVFDATSGEVKSQGNHLHGTVQSIEFDRSSKLVLSAGTNGTMVVSDALLGIAVAVLAGPHGAIRVAHFDPSARRAVGASWDGTARIWDATAPYRRWNSAASSDDCGVATSLEPDRRFVAVGCSDHPTRVWDTARDLLLAELPTMPSSDSDFAPALPAVSAAGDRAAIARGNTVEVYGLPGGALLRTITHGAVVTAVAFAPTGRELVSGAADGSVLVTGDERDPVQLPLAAGGIDAVAILRNDEVVVTDARKHLRIYGADHTVVRGDVALETRMGLLRPSDDARRLIALPSYVAETGPPVLLDLEQHRIVATLSGHIGRVFSARFVQGDREFLTAGGDGSVRSWSAASGRFLRTYRGSARYLADATLTPDGSMVVAGGGDGLLRFWDVRNGRPLWAMRAHKSALIGLHFEGADIVTRGFGGEVARWSVPKTPDIIDFAATLVP